VNAITTPLTHDVTLALRIGERVRLSGVVYSARDAAHKRMIAALTAGDELPIPLDGQVIYYVGPSPTRPGEIIGSAGPTTATRMDSYTLPLLQCGLKGMIGKGNRSADVRAGLVQHHAVYFVAVGGAAALIAACVQKADLVGYDDLGTEAIYRLEVVNFPLLVANDAHGGDLYQHMQTQWREAAPDAND
jgi:fumarate hydratase subunit beta